jgi:hypothetical protein
LSSPHVALAAQMTAATWDMLPGRGVALLVAPVVLLLLRSGKCGALVHA